jgi:alkyl sulfatase BDS1-like metallo-beta-lactamase superfamily hydrolase
VPVIAPVGFMEHAIAENVYAGNAMSRRLFFQYGVLLPRSPFGHVDQSIGKNTAAGNVGLIQPTRYIEAVPLRAGGGSDVRFTFLAALGQRPDPGSDAHPA